MDLNLIQTNARWGDAATGINDNFSRTNVEIEKLRNATFRDKGYFSTIIQLNQAWPSPVVGDFAWVGTPFPGTVFECKQNGIWINTGVVPNIPAPDLNNWNQTAW